LGSHQPAARTGRGSDPAAPPSFRRKSFWNYDWTALNERRLQLAGRFKSDNSELLDLLHENLLRVEFNRYNLELYIGIAQLFRQNIEMLEDLGRINISLQDAQTTAAKGDSEGALAAVDRALDIAEAIRQHRNRAFANAVATWRKSWYPRVAEAKGRRFLLAGGDFRHTGYGQPGPRTPTRPGGTGVVGK
jgi:hypothetical protein